MTRVPEGCGVKGGSTRNRACRQARTSAWTSWRLSTSVPARELEHGTGAAPGVARPLSEARTSGIGVWTRQGHDGLLDVGRLQGGARGDHRLAALDIGSKQRHAVHHRSRSRIALLFEIPTRLGQTPHAAAAPNMNRAISALAHQRFNLAHAAREGGLRHHQARSPSLLSTAPTRSSSFAIAAMST